MGKIKPLPAFEREKLEAMPVAELVNVILKQQEMIQQLIEEVERLKGMMSRDSKTSSKSPSSDLLKRSEKPAEQTKDPDKKKPGGQMGHAGKTRKGFGRVDRYEILRPEVCLHCGGLAFDEQPVQTKVREVAHLSPRPIEVVQYQQTVCRCQNCAALVEAQLPKDVLPGQDLGAGLQGMLVWLGHYGHLSYEKQQEWLKELGRIEVGVGTLCATTKRAATAVAQQVQELQEWVKYQPQIQVDESPWLVKGVKEWMWVFTGQRFCLFRAADTRSRAELEAVLGQVFGGVLCSDDFSVYNGYKVAAQQKCLAYMLRHFKHVIKLKPKSQAELGEVFIELIKEAFENHAQWRETKEAQSYASWAKGFKLRIADAIQTWWPKAGHAAQLLLRNLRDRAHQWWYFLDHPEVPPDNNRAERSLRLAVTKRKVCGGSRSMDGFADTATLLTVIQTCRAQGRSVIEFFRLAFSNLSDPLTLIPIPQT